MSCTYNWNIAWYEYTDDGNKREAEWEEVRDDLNKNLSNISMLASLKRIINKGAEVALNFFSIKENKTTPDGEVYTSYTARNWENSGPDYLGVNASLNVFVPASSKIHGVDLNIGYVKNDGWVIYPVTKAGLGWDISISGGITFGKYTGNKRPTGTSLEGIGTGLGGGYGPCSMDASVDYTDKTGYGRNWLLFSVNGGLGVSTVSGKIYQSTTHRVGYFRNILK